jgi:hypothetical protein
VDPVLRQRLIAVGATALALVCGWHIANGSLGLASVVAVFTLLLTASAVLSIAPDVLVAAGVIVGYLVGNRGFAQLHPPDLPLLPAEAALGLALACGLWRWARARQLPFLRNLLNAAVVLWIALAAIRVPMDVRSHGAIALRDFAMVYYALFFFLAQSWSEVPRHRSLLLAALVAGLALVVPVFLVFDQWPEWFTTVLTVAGAPLIFVKSDVAAAFMAGAVLYFAVRFSQRRRPIWLGLSALSLLGLALANSRAAVVAFALGLLWLFVLRKWRVLGVIGAMVLCGVFALGVQALASRVPFTGSPLYRIYESAASVIDPDGVRQYQAADLQDKPDNNQFRMVWWRELIGETWDHGRWLGLGFGRDLALEFLRTYYADANEDFSARSPHNFLLTVFGRTGLVGLISFTLVLIGMTRCTVQAGRAGQDDSSLGLWLIAWAILGSACFGVVLEGPMGAVVFWTVLGLAAGTPREDATVLTESEVNLEAPSLPAPAERAAVGAST